MAEKILVLGLSKSGISAAKLAINLGYDVYLTEGKKDVNEVQVQELKNLGINVEFGGHSDSFIKDANLVVTSPGIPPKSDIFKRILEKNIPIRIGVNAGSLEKDLYDTLEICYEMVSRGYRLTNIDINRSLATEFLVNPDDNHEIIPPFKVLDGLGDNVAISIVNARKERPFISKEDLMNRTQLSNTLVKRLSDLGILNDLDETNQISLF